MHRDFKVFKSTDFHFRYNQVSESLFRIQNTVTNITLPGIKQPNVHANKLHSYDYIYHCIVWQSLLLVLKTYRYIT